MLGKWKKYQFDLRKTIATMQSELVKINKLAILIKTDYAKLTKHIIVIKEDRITQVCQNIYAKYKALQESFLVI